MSTAITPTNQPSAEPVKTKSICRKFADLVKKIAKFVADFFTCKLWQKTDQRILERDRFIQEFCVNDPEKYLRAAGLIEEEKSEEALSLLQMESFTKPNPDSSLKRMAEGKKKSGPLVRALFDSEPVTNFYKTKDVPKRLDAIRDLIGLHEQELYTKIDEKRVYAPLNRVINKLVSELPEDVTNNFPKKVKVQDQDLRTKLLEAINVNLSN